MEIKNTNCTKELSKFDATLYQTPNPKYVSPVKEGLNQIPLIACSAVEWYIFSREEEVRLIGDCNFNVGLIGITNGFIIGALTAAQSEKSDVQLLVNGDFFHPSIYDQAKYNVLKNNLESYEKFPNYAGCEFSDEPSWEDIHSSSFQNFYHDMEELTEGKTLYFNLIGANNSKHTNGNELPEYLNEIQRIFHPMVWSFDYYPLRIDREIFYKKGREDGKDIYTEQIVTRLRVESEGFYTALQAYLRQSQLTQRPFWYYCQSVGYVNTSANVNRPQPTYPFLRFQIFTALAYGARGIAYWTSRQRVDEINTLFFSAPIDYTNNPTPLFDVVKALNNEITEYNDIFMYSNVMKIMHVGQEEFPNTCIWDNWGEIPFGPVDSITVERTDGHTDRATPAGVVMSHLATAEKDYLMIVSRDPICAQFVKIQFSDRFKILEYTPLANFKEPWEIYYGYQKPSMRNPLQIENKIERLLIGGGYMIFSWEKC